MISASKTSTPRSLLTRSSVSTRQRVLGELLVAGVVLTLVLVFSALLESVAHTPQLAQRNQPPSMQHIFGTDALGRDLFARTLVGLRLSLIVGVAAASIAVLITAALSLLAATGRAPVERLVTWLTDAFLAVPHLVLLIVLTYVMGGGVLAVIVAVGASHWPALTRVVRAKIAPELSADHVALARALGSSGSQIARVHLLPVVGPQLIVGGVLVFPHAILHEAALSFLGLGIDPAQPAIGNLLSGAMQQLSMGYWWAAVLPGLSLLLLVLLVDSIGDNLRSMIDPRRHQL